MFYAVIVHDCKDFLQDRKVIGENLFRHFEIDVNRGVRFSTSSICRATTSQRPEGTARIMRGKVQFAMCWSRTVGMLFFSTVLRKPRDDAKVNSCRQIGFVRLIRVDCWLFCVSLCPLSSDVKALCLHCQSCGGVREPRASVCHRRQSVTGEAVASHLRAPY